MKENDIHKICISPKALEQVHQLLNECLSKEDIDTLIPANDALRVWWSPVNGSLRIEELLNIINGSNDHLSLLALVQFARNKKTIPAELEKELTSFLLRSSIDFRGSSFSYRSSFHAIVSYSHLDKGRVKILLSVLKNAGVKVFHDVKHIMPGESIVGRLHDAMSTVPRAILMISENYLSSEWTKKELDLFLSRSKTGNMKILPVLIDNIELPDRVKDIFTIDLRGFQNESDKTWAEVRLKKLIDECLQNS